MLSSLTRYRTASVRLFSVISHQTRSHLTPKHGQLLQLAPAEEAQVKVAMTLKGSMRVTLVVELDQGVDLVHMFEALGKVQNIFFIFVWLVCGIYSQLAELKAI